MFEQAAGQCADRALVRLSHRHSDSRSCQILQRENLFGVPFLHGDDDVGVGHIDRFLEPVFNRIEIVHIAGHIGIRKPASFAGSRDTHLPGEDAAPVVHGGQINSFPLAKRLQRLLQGAAIDGTGKKRDPRYVLPDVSVDHFVMARRELLQATVARGDESRETERGGRVLRGCENPDLNLRTSVGELGDVDHT